MVPVANAGLNAPAVVVKADKPALVDIIVVLAAAELFEGSGSVASDDAVAVTVCKAPPEATVGLIEKETVIVLPEARPALS